jgi:glycosyltransferase involved in cell wall biosynthesis
LVANVRILFLTQYYYPEPVEKVHDLARGLVRRGHDVQVLTSFPCYPRGEIYDGYRLSLGKQEVIDGVRVLRVPQIPDHSRTAWKRAAYYLSFALSAATIGLARVGPADVMLVYQAALPIGLATWVLHRLRRLPVVLDVVDLWPESIMSSGMLENPLAWRAVERVARWVYADAQHVSVVTEGYRRNLLRLGVPDEKLGVIPNWMPSDTYHVEEPDPLVAEREGIAGRFTVMYAGNMGPLQDLGTVLQAAELLRDDPDVQFVLVGDGLQFPELVARARERNLTNVKFLGRRPPETMPSLYAHAGALLVHLRPDPLSDVTIPSKLFAYLACGRPIIVGVRGDAEAFVRKGGFGVAVPPSDPAAMAQAVRELAHAPAAERERMGATALRLHREEFSSEVQTTRFEALLERVVGEAGAGAPRAQPVRTA